MSNLVESYHTSWRHLSATYHATNTSCNTVTVTVGKEAHVEACDTGIIPDSMSQPADVRCSRGTCLQGLATRVHTCCRYVGPRCSTAGRPAAPPALAPATGHPSCCAHQPVREHVSVDRDATDKAWLFIHNNQ